MASVSSSAVAFRVPFAAWIFSSLGKKTIVALTGIALVLFVIGHLAGNLTFFAGPDWLNSYGQHLRDLGPLLWAARIGLLAAVFFHIYFTMLLWKENQAARPQKYAVSAPMKTTVFARTMRLTGLFVLAFVVFHLAHFTWGWVQPHSAHLKDSLGRHDIYTMVVTGFAHPLIALIYVVGLFLLTFHLSHGIGSLFQTLGLSTSKLRPFYENLARGLAWVLFLGYVAIPISVQLGLGQGVLK